MRCIPCYAVCCHPAPLTVAVTLFCTHKMLYVVTHAPDRNRPAEQAAFFKGVQALVVSKVSDYQSRCVVWMGDHNNVDNPHLDVDPPEAWRPHVGAEALQDVAADLGLIDAWRCRNGALLEFTHFPSGQRAATDARRHLDRALVSSPMALGHSLPHVRKAWHIHPADPLLFPSVG